MGSCPDTDIGPNSSTGKKNLLKRDSPPACGIEARVVVALDKHLGGTGSNLVGAWTFSAIASIAVHLRR